MLATTYRLLTRAFSFQTLADGRPTTQISSLRNTATAYDVTLSYTYDGNGNITSVSDGTNTSSYVYDSANQLLRENNQAAGKTWVWTYDDAGNILSRTEYAYTTGELGDPVDTVLYTYGNADWGDLLTGYDGNTITYDGIGNPLSDGTWTYTWQNGRELASMSNGVTTWTYTYDANGMRKSRSDGTNTYTYLYNGSQLVQMTKGEDTLHFYYDAAGTPVAIKHNTTLYYCVTTVQGDVLVLVDATGQTAVYYDYDAWGNIHGIFGTKASTLGILNPLTYRGYTYDHETGLYYLQSRYYNPDVGRFHSHDIVFDYDAGLQGYNLFLYCGNDPVNRIDISGTDSVQIDNDEDNLGDEVPRGGLLTGGQNNTSSIDGSSITIYRYGYLDAGAQKLVPTKEDVNMQHKSGLSFSTNPKPGAAMTTTDAVNATGVLRAVVDGTHHVSVYPVGYALADWRAAGVNSIWTQALLGIVQISPEKEFAAK